MRNTCLQPGLKNKFEEYALNILQIISGRQLNGALTHCHKLTEQLIKNGHQVTAICRRQSWLWDQLPKIGANRAASEMTRTRAGLTFGRNVIERDEIDVIHTHQSRAHFFGVLLKWKTGVPCVATAHSRHIQLHWMANDHIIAVSEATRDFHRRRNLIRAHKISTIHNFIESRDPTCARESVRKRLLQEFDIPTQARIVAIIGDIIPRKGLTTLLPAFKQSLGRAPDSYLLVVGRESDKKYTAVAKNLSASLGIESNVRWLGLRHDVPDLLNTIDVYALPSLEESLPMAILEAMSAGLPILASNVGGIPECVIDGQNGMLVPAKNVDSLSNALSTLLEDAAIRQKLGQAGKSSVARNFSPSTQTQKVENIYEQLIGAHASRKKVNAATKRSAA